MRRLAAGALAAGAAALAGLPAPAAAQSSPLGTARLAGQFAMSGQVTSAVHVRDERRGQSVRRTWTFTPLCAAGACDQISLLRQRAAGSDRLVLVREGPAHYTGRGSFYVPLRCDGRLYRRGELVPFTIDVRVTHATAFGPAPAADAINATYTNRSRRNLTPCVAIPGHDAAQYRGQLVPSSGGVGL